MYLRVAGCRIMLMMLTWVCWKWRLFADMQVRCGIICLLLGRMPRAILACLKRYIHVIVHFTHGWLTAILYTWMQCIAVSDVGIEEAKYKDTMQSMHSCYIHSSFCFPLTFVPRSLKVVELGSQEQKADCTKYKLQGLDSRTHQPFKYHKHVLCLKNILDAMMINTICVFSQVCLATTSFLDLSICWCSLETNIYSWPC